MIGVRLVSACVLVGAAASCGGGDAPVEMDGFAVRDAWARPTPAGVDESAFYVTVENLDAPPDRLIGAASDRCTTIVPHATEIVDDVASMGEPTGDRLRLAPGDRIEMEPLGMHLMCLGLTTPLRDGDVATVELRFGEHDPITVDVTVEQR